MDTLAEFVMDLASAALWAGGTTLVLALAGYYTIYALVQNNILFTGATEGWCRIILHKGKFHKIVGPGWHWMGLPGIYTLYKRKMTFFKSVTEENGMAKAEPHEDEDVSAFKTTEYPYACAFKDEEDSHGLHLSGIWAVFAVIEDYRKAFFVVSDWYAEMNTKILSCHRMVLVNVSYDDDIVGRDKKDEQAKAVISTRLWTELNTGRDGKPPAYEYLLEHCGIRILSVELRSIDPPPEYRAITLEPYTAERKKAAAVHQAETSAILFDDTNQALKAWLKGQQDAGLTPTQAQIEAKQNELRERALAKTPGYQQVDIRGLERATTAVVGGGGAAGILVGGAGGKPVGKKGGSGKKSDPSKMSAEEIDEALGESDESE